MYCANCGSQLDDNAVFCSVCGAKVGTTASELTTSTTNVHLEKAKVISKGYFSYFMDHIKAPIRHGFAIERSNWLNGLITLVIFSVFMSFTALLMAYSVRSGINEFFGGYINKVSFLDDFLLPLLYSLLMFAVIVGIIFLVAKLMKSEANLQDILARYGTFMIIPTAFAILTFLLVLLHIYVLALLFSFGYLLSLVCAIVLTVYSYGKEKSSGLDPYYGILIAFLGLIIAMFLFGSSVFNNLTNIF